MQIDPDGHPPWPLMLALAGLAAIGGALRYVSAYLRDGGRWRWAWFFAHACVSAFAGVIAVEAAMWLAGLKDPEPLAVIAGISGWLGREALEVLSEIAVRRARERLGAPAPPNPPPNPPDLDKGDS